MASKFDEVRSDVIAKVREFLDKEGFDAVKTGSQEIAIPVVNADGDEGWIVLTFRVPTGSRDGDIYDGYTMAQEYEMKQKEKAEKAAKAAAAKAKKIARDEKMRAQKAAAKAAKESEVK